MSDGFAHAVAFEVDGHSPGEEPVRLATPSDVTVRAQVAFAPAIPKAVAYGGITPAAGRRMVGDTVNLHAPRTEDVVQGGVRLVEIVVNGQVAAQSEVPADGKIHTLEFRLPIGRSSWVALRQFPQLHTNPVDVIVADKPIRASRESALWCAETIKLLWTNRKNFISEAEQTAAKEAYDRAIETYVQIASEVKPTTEF